LDSNKVELIEVEAIEKSLKT